MFAKTYSAQPFLADYFIFFLKLKYICDLFLKIYIFHRITWTQG